MEVGLVLADEVILFVAIVTTRCGVVPAHIFQFSLEDNYHSSRYLWD